MPKNTTVAWTTARTDKDAKIIGEWFERNA